MRGKIRFNRVGKLGVLLTLGLAVSLIQVQSFGSGDLNATAEAALAQVCYSFQTIEQGGISGFGYYCDGYSADPRDAHQEALHEVHHSVLWPCYADVAQPRFESIIRDECVWIDYWNEHASLWEPPPPVPEIDFDRYVVVAVIAGWRPNSCYGMQITHITGNPYCRKIHVRERVPCPGEMCLQVITNPYHFIRVCKEFLPYDVPVCFEHRNMTPLCVAYVLCPDDNDPVPAGTE